MRLATVQVSRVFTTGISRNKEIQLKVLIEDDSKFLGHPLSVFYPLQTVRKVLIDRNHAGSSKARSAQGASQAEFLREGIFRCRAGVGGQGSRAAMESP